MGEDILLVEWISSHGASTDVTLLFGVTFFLHHSNSLDWF